MLESRIELTGRMGTKIGFKSGTGKNVANTDPAAQKIGGAVSMKKKKTSRG